MDSIDLNFLNESEIEVIVNVIEKDFELKAAEKTRLCRLRKKLIRNDQIAVELSQTSIDGLNCVICFKKFIMFFNPKKTCCSCSLQVCRSCCTYIKAFENNVCKICQQQKDLIAMNCLWFYENIRRKFMDGGSQIIANSLSEYPRKNFISPAILTMVKGTQITKFRYQIEDASRTIEESLIKVELSFTDSETKAIKYTELIHKFMEKLKQILRNTSQVLYITMENYLNKIGKKNNNIDLEVLDILHEEVELLIGRKIDIRSCQRNLLSGKKSLDDLDGQDSLETKLSSPIVDKLLLDVQQLLLENRGKEYDDLNSTLKSMVKKNKYDLMDFDYESISQAPSRQGTVRRGLNLVSPQKTLFESTKSFSLESLHSSRLYDLSEVGEKSKIVSKQWNELMANNSSDMDKMMSSTQGAVSSPTVSTAHENSMTVDSDALSMNLSNQVKESNWLMTARYPIGSLQSLFIESNNSYDTKLENKKPNSARSEIIKREKNLDDEVDAMFKENRSILSNPDDSNIDKEYERNKSVLNPVQNLNKGYQCIESGESQDSGIVTRVKAQSAQKPSVPFRKSRIIQSPAVSHIPPPIPQRKSYINTKSSIINSEQDSSSDSSVKDVKMKKLIVIKSKRR